MKTFTQWLQENTDGGTGVQWSTGWANPNLNDPESRYHGIARPDAIQNHVTHMMTNYKGHDPVQGMSNIAANANMHKQPDYHRGPNKPLNWQMLSMLRQWGFGNADQFYKWWQNGGKEQVAQMRDQHIEKNRSNFG